MNVVHVYWSIDGLGGVESLIRMHLKLDSLSGLSSKAVAVMQKEECATEGGISLCCNGRNSPAQIAKQYRGTHFSSKADTIVFHNLWGIGMLSGEDLGCRKIGYIHSNSRQMMELLDKRARHFHGFLCAGEDLATEVGLRIAHLSRPVLPLHYSLPDHFFSGPSETIIHNRPRLVIGYSGRLCHEQKRIERLIPFVEELRGCDIDFDFEIAGSGPNASTLLSQPSFRDSILSLEDLRGEEYLNKIARWDFLIVCSDYETGPIVALEAMALGVIPILPDIPCMASRIIRKIDASLLYPVGDMVAAALIVKMTDPEKRKTVAMRLRQEMDAYTGSSYAEKFSRRLVEVEEQSRSVTIDNSPPGFVVAHMPFGVLRRLPALGFG